MGQCCDFCSSLIRRIAWRCLNCRDVTLCNSCFWENDPEDIDVLREHKLNHVFLRILDYQTVKLEYGEAVLIK